MDYRLLQLAESGDAEAQYQLGMAYHNGDGVEQDDYKALEWFKKSAAANHPAANGMCGEFLMNGTATAQDTNGSALYFTTGANLGDVFSQYRIGWVFWNSSNYDDAIPYLEQAANAGSAPAKCLLAKSYFNGFGVIEDKTKALELFEEAAYLGDAEAQYMASACYGFGYGTDVDIDQAYYYCKKSADQGHESAINNLSIFKNAQEDPEAYMENLRKVNESREPAKPAPAPTYTAPTYTPPATSSYEPPKKNKKPGSIGVLVLLVIFVWPVAIWYALTHDLSL